MRKNIPYSTFAYCITTALSAIYINQLATKINPVASLLICVISSTFFFHLINYKNIKVIYIKFIETYKTSIAMNVSAGIVWVSTFIGLSIIDPYIYIVIYFIIPSAISFISTYRKNKSILDLISGLSLFIILGLSVYLYVHEINHIHNIFYGISLALLGGVFSYIYRVQAKSYSLTTKCTASMVLCVRSYGIILFSATLLVFYPKIHSNAIPFNLHIVTLLLVVTILSFIIPLYFNQKGIEIAGAKLHSIICASIPLITLILSEFGHNQYVREETIGNYILAILISAFLILPGLIKKGYSD
jgi:hypothetical protein